MKLKNFNFATFGGHLGFLRKTENVNISETARDRVILTEFLTRRVIAKYPPLLAAILDFCGKPKNVNISETVRDRAISTEFLTHMVVEEYSM